MKSKRMFAFAASIFGLALWCVPNALAACGVSSIALPHPTAFQLQMGQAHLLRAALDGSPSDTESTPSIVGMWHVTFTSEGADSGLPAGTPVDNALVVWHSDHTEIMNSARPPQDGNFCMGVWQQTGKLTYSLNHFAWLGNMYDPTNPEAWSEIGPPQGPTHIVETVTLSPDGNHYSGTFTLDAYDTSFNVTMHITGVISATRITTNTTVGDLM